jgi:hypothetical protein
MLVYHKTHAGHFVREPDQTEPKVHLSENTWLPGESKEHDAEDWRVENAFRGRFVRVAQSHNSMFE